MGERDWAEVYDPVDGAAGGHNGRVEADLRTDEQIRRAGEEGGNDLWLPHAQRRVEETRWCDGVRRDAAEHRLQKLRVPTRLGRDVCKRAGCRRIHGPTPRTILLAASQRCPEAGFRGGSPA